MSKPPPPGIHLQATPVGETSAGSPVRLLGDDNRGYLIAGLTHLPELEDVEVWFPTFEAAMEAGERLGIKRRDWTEFTPPVAL